MKKLTISECIKKIQKLYDDNEKKLKSDKEIIDILYIEIISLLKQYSDFNCKIKNKNGLLTTEIKIRKNNETK